MSGSRSGRADSTTLPPVGAAGNEGRMDRVRLVALLEAVARGETTIEAALDRLRTLPFEDLEFARLDHHRELRNGFGEVVFGAGKSTEELIAIVRRLADATGRVLVTRVDADAAARSRPPSLADVPPRVPPRDPLDVSPAPIADETVLVVAAGHRGRRRREEAALTAEFLARASSASSTSGCRACIGSSPEHERLRRAGVLIVVAGMEGALPSVVGGLVAAPVIAVPTSIGYGASFGGLAALLAMLNTCAAGVVVVNIDNGFGRGRGGGAHAAAAALMAEITSGRARRLFSVGQPHVGGRRQLPLAGAQAAVPVRRARRRRPAGDAHPERRAHRRGLHRAPRRVHEARADALDADGPVPRRSARSARDRAVERAADAVGARPRRARRRSSAPHPRSASRASRPRRSPPRRSGRSTARRSTTAPPSS
jgi:NCAIR mutase (PurE)-related protein